MVLYDIKQMDTASNKQHIGVPNERILTNLRRIGEYGISVEIRMPIIPGINDARETVRRAVRFLSDVEKITRVLLLPYHKLGETKYTRLEREAYKLRISIPLIRTECRR